MHKSSNITSMWSYSRTGLKVDLIDRKPFGSDLNVISTETGIFTVLGVGVYSTLCKGYRIKTSPFFWFRSMFNFLWLVSKKKGVSATETESVFSFSHSVVI